MKSTETMDLKYDFSILSKRRLATYNLLVEEWERQGYGNEPEELGDDVLELLSAAGTTEMNPTPTPDGIH